MVEFQGDAVPPIETTFNMHREKEEIREVITLISTYPFLRQHPSAFFLQCSNEGQHQAEFSKLLNRAIRRKNDLRIVNDIVLCMHPLGNISVSSSSVERDQTCPEIVHLAIYCRVTAQISKVWLERDKRIEVEGMGSMGR